MNRVHAQKHQRAKQIIADNYDNSSDARYDQQDDDRQLVDRFTQQFGREEE